MSWLATNRLLPAAIAFLLATSPICSVAEVPRYEAVPLVRYVLETDKIPYLSVYWARVKSGSLIYDDEYRHPTYPPGPTTVDCMKTRRIGLTFIVNRRVSRNLEHVPVRFVWTHSSVRSKDAKAMWTSTETFSRIFQTGQESQYYSSGLVLTDELRVDGTISVRILVGGNTVLENAFTLSRCSQGTSQDMESG